jgi:Ca2+-binding RTX toxin-like protein
MSKAIRSWVGSASRQKSNRKLLRSSRIVAEALEGRTLFTAALAGTTLNITGTSGADVLTLSDDDTTITVIQNATTSTFADTTVSQIVVNPSAGGDTVNLQSNTKPVTITGGGQDTVNLGVYGTLSRIMAAVSISNPASFTNLALSGSADTLDQDLGPIPPPGTLSASAISGLSPGTISYTAGQLSALAITTGYNLIVAGTGTLEGNAATVVSGVLGAVDSPPQTITVLATTGPLTINAGTDQSTDIGAGNTQSIDGAVTIQNADTANGSSLLIDDSNDQTGRNVTLAAQASAGSPIAVNGISPAPILYVGAVADSQLVVNSGAGNDTLTVGAGAYNSSDTINCGDGNDTVIVPATYSGPSGIYINGGTGNDTLRVGGGNFSAGAGLNSNYVVFNGGTGSNTVIADDSSDTNPAQFTIDSKGTITNLTTGTQCENTRVQQIDILCGSGNDWVNASPSLTIPLLVHGGAGDDVINGGGASDTLYGDAGNDYLNGGPGADSLVGGTGIDTILGGPGQPIEVDADNLANAASYGSQGVTITGACTSATTSAGFYGTNYLQDGNSGKGSKSVQWTPQIPSAGTYQVYARWTAGANRASQVPFTVTHQGIASTVLENEQVKNNIWVLLGTYSLNAGTSSSVTVSNAGTTGYVIADAVRFVQVFSNATITGSVFNDLNGDGKQTLNEPGISGRMIYIDSNLDGILDNNEPSTNTDADGNWSFANLAPGSYTFREQNLPGIRHTNPPGTANFHNITVTASSMITGVLFGDQSMILPPVPILAINAGGPTFVLNTGVTYQADTDFTGGAAANIPTPIANTDNDPIFYSYRTGSSFSYSIPVPNGTYNLVLNFVDPTDTAAGQRKFNVSVQGKQVLTNFDIVAATGPSTAISKAYAVIVTNGTLNLTFTGTVGNAILSGIVLYSM